MPNKSPSEPHPTLHRMRREPPIGVSVVGVSVGVVVGVVVVVVVGVVVSRGGITST